MLRKDHSRKWLCRAVCALTAILMHGRLCAQEREALDSRRADPGESYPQRQLFFDSRNPGVTRALEDFLRRPSLSGSATSDALWLQYAPAEFTLDQSGLPHSSSIPAGYDPLTDRTYAQQVLRASVVIGTAELALFGVMVLLPKDVTKWQDDWVEDGLRNWGRAHSAPPVWDQDDWVLNYVGHPMAGSVYYNAIREQGGSPGQSFLFSFIASAFWEYTIEAVAEQPSTQDLIVTPVGGALLGELAHQVTNAMRKGGTNLPEKILITIINPMSVVFNGYREVP